MKGAKKNDQSVAQHKGYGKAPTDPQRKTVIEKEAFLVTGFHRKGDPSAQRKGGVSEMGVFRKFGHLFSRSE